MGKFFKYKNFYAFVSSLTIAIMFVLFSQIKKNYPTTLEDDKYFIWGGFITFAFSATLYDLLSKLITLVLNTSRWLKAKFMGKHFIEGIWVGFISEKPDDVSFIVEVISQKLEEINVAGSSFKINEKGNFYKTAYWQSDITKLIQINNEIELIYTYDNVELKGNDKNDKYTGFAKFRFETFRNGSNTFQRELGQKLPLIKSFIMRGELYDLKSSKEFLTSKEIKITDHINYAYEDFVPVAYNYWKTEMQKLQHKELHITTQ